MKRGIHLLQSGLVGAAVGYFVLSPFSMVLFHLTHADLDAMVCHQMQHSLLASVRDAFRPVLLPWWTAFILLGALLGTAVGLAMASLRERTDALHRQSSALCEANGELQESFRQLQHANRMATLGLMAGTVIHDVNGYLAGLMLLAHAELDEIVPSERASSPWADVCEQLQRLRALVQSVRRFSRVTSGERAVLDLHEVLQDGIRLNSTAFAAQGVRVSLGLGATQSSVEGNRAELLQVFMNLFRNALDAMETGGHLAVTTAHAGGGWQQR
ncbi:MAG: hypothetical protein HY904_14555 [Deltaproteobacteria bacterium]|nr:hypothetical protein [Deltaproteobacteria bacterium]